jgi:deaminated glutathione amidase
MTTLAVIQMVSTPNVDENLATACLLIADAARAGAELVSLPEYFCLMARDDSERLRIAEVDGAGPIQSMLSDAARRHGIWIIGGTLPIRSANAPRARNACCVFNPAGSRVARYDKMHLFAFAGARESYDEATVLEAGDTPVVVRAAGIRTGLSVCYDLRFPELYRALSLIPDAAPLDLIAVPSAFTYTTGRSHWEVLLRARAVENQCYVLASAQGGTHESGARTWGHSMIVDPWGDVLATVDEGEGIAFARFDRARIDAVRAQLPALQHRRL